MPEKRTDETPSSTPPPALRAAAGPVKVRKCKTCKREVTAALVHGECADCAGLVPLPLRGEGGRFLSFGTTSSKGRGWTP